MNSRKAQIWVETVMYTLIGISIIGILLAASRPKIQSIQDRLVIEQMIDSMNELHKKILEVQDRPGNQNVVSMKISKGNLILDKEEDSIRWEMDSTYKYSQPEVPVSLGDLTILTRGENRFKVQISLNYSDIGLELNDNKDKISLEESSRQYNLLIRSEANKIYIEVRDI